VTTRVDRFGWTCSNTKTALKTSLIVNADRLIMDINAISWANIKTAGACLRFSGGTSQTTVSV